jgi:prepilin-type N-terminal cleavage/methylation domain-containing protein
VFFCSNVFFCIFIPLTLNLHCHKSLFMASPPPRLRSAAGFTLIELLMVLALVGIMAALIVPAFDSVGKASQTTKAVYDITGALEQARAYAMARNTYVWVGFLEEDASKPSPSTPVTSANGPGGRVIISTVASQDGSRYSDVEVSAAVPPPFTANPPANSKNRTRLVQTGKLLKLENVRMATLNDGQLSGSVNEPTRPPVAAKYQVGDPAFARVTASSGGTVPNPATFTYPLSGTVQYTFQKAIEFSPQGTANQIVDNVVNGPQKWIEIGLQPTHGNRVSAGYNGTSKAFAAIMIEGLTGRVEVIQQ